MHYVTHHYKSHLSSSDTRQLWKSFGIDSIMDILIFNKTLLKVLAIWSKEIFDLVNWTILRLIRYVGLLLLFVMTIASSIAYAIQNIDDIVECTSALYVSLAFITSVCTYCALIYHRERIQSVLTIMQAIVKIRKKYFLISFIHIYFEPDLISFFIQRNFWRVRISASLRECWIFLYTHLQAIRSLLDCDCWRIFGIFDSGACVLRNHGSNWCPKLETSVQNDVGLDHSYLMFVYLFSSRTQKMV